MNTYISLVVKLIYLENELNELENTSNFILGNTESKEKASLLKGEIEQLKNSIETERKNLKPAHQAIITEIGKIEQGREQAREEISRGDEEMEL